MGEIYMYVRLKKIYVRFNRFDIERSTGCIVQISKPHASLDSPAHKEYKNYCLVSVE